MNIFALSLDPKVAAQGHGDKHVVKMILETCQMLYTAHWIAAYPELLAHRAPVRLAAAHKLLTVPTGMLTAPLRLSTPEPGYRPVHTHHPCTIWVRASVENYMWAADLALAIAEEYEYRWPGRTHACKAHAEWLKANPPMPSLPEGRLMPFALAMPDEYKVADPVVSYINFYKGSKQDRGLTTYTRRPPPAFLERHI
jgi:hypothetical protein